MPRLSLLILPAALAIAVYLIINSFNSPTPLSAEDTANFPTDLTAISEGINTVSYDEQGDVAYTLQAQRQIQRDDDTSELESPVIRLFRDNNAQWNIVANSGNISAQQTGRAEDSRELTLSGEVRLVNLDDFGNTTTLNTDYLTIMPDREIAETDQQVFLITTNIEHTALGMIADFANDEIIFLSNSEGRYVPVSE